MAESETDPRLPVHYSFLTWTKCSSKVRVQMWRVKSSTHTYTCTHVQTCCRTRPCSSAVCPGGPTAHLQPLSLPPSTCQFASYLTGTEFVHLFSTRHPLICTCICFLPAVCLASSQLRPPASLPGLPVLGHLPTACPYIPHSAHQVLPVLPS